MLVEFAAQVLLTEVLKFGEWMKEQCENWRRFVIREIVCFKDHVFFSILLLELSIRTPPILS